MAEKEITLKIKKFPQEGDLQNTYSALHNKLSVEGKVEEARFDNRHLGIDVRHPLNIECQPSYDGTVNLIINDDINPPRIINSRFTKLEDHKYKVINRNQSKQSNLYDEGKVDPQTRLFRNINTFPYFAFTDLTYSGNLKGGNYTFYAKFADNDYNKTDIVAESGIVSIFKGDLNQISSISGTLLDERTDKAITLTLRNVDTSFQKIYIYYVRTYSDTNGIRMEEAAQIKEPFEIKGSKVDININGYEHVLPVSIEELNVKYNLVTAAKTQAQVQNMLFLGNVQGEVLDYAKLQNLSYYIRVTMSQEASSIGFLDHRYNVQGSEPIDAAEYYNPQNIYYKLGYWPDELYRLGIVYILEDDSLSPVFNLKGCVFEEIEQSNWDDKQLVEEIKDSFPLIPKSTFLTNSQRLYNSLGVFKTPDVSILNKQNINGEGSIRPLFFRIQLAEKLREELKTLKIKGYFIVRQKRMATSLCQGMAIGVDGESGVPMLKNPNDTKWFVEDFKNGWGELTTDLGSHKAAVSKSQGAGLLCLDAMVNPTIQSALDGSEFVLKNYSKSVGHVTNSSISQRHYYIQDYLQGDSNKANAKLVYVPENSPMIYINEFSYSTMAGIPEEVSSFSFVEKKQLDTDKPRTVRGLFTPFIGVNKNLIDYTIYTIKVPNYSESRMRDYIEIRGKNNEAFFAITDRYSIDEGVISAARGDCFTNTITVRLNRNFIDPEMPLSDTIIDTNTWKKNYKGFKSSETQENWIKINRADVNAVPLGVWITFKCLSNSNLGLRCEDKSYTDEMAQMGGPRTFYPLSDILLKSSHKVAESSILNDGYGSTVGVRRNYIAQDVPYVKDIFDSRVMFSNVQRNDDFKNSYRIFQGLSYADIDRQYGAIVKLIPAQTNLFCVFEHGLGILPINEKALIQTTSGQSIHMYGAGVMQNQISLISPDFGSIWPESIVQSPYGIYGVDTYAKKIWRFGRSLEILSDNSIQRFLNEEINLKEDDKCPIIGLKNVKTHYNAYKGDVIFTFYNRDKEWSICYNERLGKWTTRYSWTPLYSENINNMFFSMDKKRAEILSKIAEQKVRENGLRMVSEGAFTPYLINHAEKLQKSSVSVNVTSYSYIDGDLIPSETTPLSTFAIVNDSLGILQLPLQDIKPVFYELTVQYQIEGLSTQYTSSVIMIGDKTSPFWTNSFYLHGRAGVFDSLDYTNESMADNITPTYWYDKQEPFEIEFVVNEGVGVHKIFDNLAIVSNNAEPDSIEFEIIGDVYNFAPEKRNIKWLRPSPIKFKNCSVKWDSVLNEYTLCTTQKCEDMNLVGRIKGNIQYKEDTWYSQIQPIKYTEDEKPKEARLRDKYLKVRIKYKGDKLVIITAIKSIFTLSYA